MLHIDQMGRPVDLARPPQRIISLVPSQTEFLHDIGLGDKVVGITKFCIHPKVWYKEKKRVGGTKNVDFAAIAALQPDLIIANKEENTRSEIEALAKLYPVWISDIYNLDDALEMMRKIGDFWAGDEAQTAAYTIAAQISHDFGAYAAKLNTQKIELAQLGADKKPLHAAYFIWREPYMVAAKDTFIDDMLARAGFANAFGALSRYPVLSAEDLEKADLAAIFLSSEPYPFKAKHVAEFAALCPNTKIEIVDGEIFSWYGSRLRHAPAYFAQLAAKMT
jgi:ABC-type Fe3+-hydroxamate transport system substrate-binding protein